MPRFQVPLPILPVLQPQQGPDPGADYYTMTMRVAQQQILPGRPPTTIWGFNGRTPGPVIRARRNRPTVVRQVNRLQEPTSTHLHGMSTLHEFDGYPEDLVRPGTSKIYRYPNRNHATTMWYHDPAIHMTSRHVYRGQSGIYIVEDPAENELRLPSGQYDVALSIQDRLFAPNGQLIYNNNGEKGVEGDVVLINGAPFPRFEVANRKYRFRMLNGSDYRRYKFALSTGQPFMVIGSDSGLLPQRVVSPTVESYPAERYEVVIDFSEYPVGTQVVLQNRFEDPDQPIYQIMRFDVVREATDNSEVPLQLQDAVNPYPALLESEAVQRRYFLFHRHNGLWVINKKVWNENQVDATPKLGDVEIWTLENNAGGWFHPIHIHLPLDGFKILSRENGPVQPYERGRKDTVALGRTKQHG